MPLTWLQSYRGTLVYADAHRMEVAIDAFCESRGSCVGLDELQVEGLAISVDHSQMAAAKVWADTTTALRGLASTATSGGIDATDSFEGDPKNERIEARKSSKKLPARHHDWEIFFAARADHGDRLRALAAEGVSLDRSYEIYGGASPLHVAAEAGSVEAVQVLLGAGIAADVASRNGRSPLHAAANAAVARMLLAAGAIITDEALVTAFEAGREDIAAALLDAGAAVPASYELRVDLVYACALHAWTELLHRLVERAPGIVEVFAGDRIMRGAIAGGEPVMVDFLLAHGSALPDDFLQRAWEADSLALVEMGLRAPDALEIAGPSSTYDDAMVHAASRADLLMMQLLARHGVPLAPPEPARHSPLHVLAGSDDPKSQDAIRWLLDQNVPIDSVDDEGATPLARAISFGSADNAILLLQLGADPSALDTADAGDLDNARRAGGARWTAAVAAARRR